MEAMTSVVIAVDSRPLIGAGHVSRVIAVAEELITRKYLVSWFVSDATNFHNLLNFFQVNLDVSNEIRINQMHYSTVDFLIIDSYDELFIQEAIQICNPGLIIQIVDETSPASILASMRWSGSILSEKARMRLGERCELYSGLEFVPIRNKVKELRTSNELVPRMEKNSIIVTLGASDQAVRIIDKVVGVIRDLSSVEDVFISHPNYRMNFVSKNFKYLDPKDMLTTAIKRNSLVICGGGITSLELLFLRLDFLVVEVADNQAAQIEYLCKNKYSEALQLGNPKQDKQALLRGLTNQTTKNQYNIDSLGQGSSLLVDWVDRNRHLGAEI